MAYLWDYNEVDKEVNIFGRVQAGNALGCSSSDTLLHLEWRLISFPPPQVKSHWVSCVVLSLLHSVSLHADLLLQGASLCQDSCSLQMETLAVMIHSTEKGCWLSKLQSSFSSALGRRWRNGRKPLLSWISTNLVSCPMLTVPDHAGKGSIPFIPLLRAPGEPSHSPSVTSCVQLWQSTPTAGLS